jgi:hypothetical protein
VIIWCNSQKKDQIGAHLKICSSIDEYTVTKTEISVRYI